MLTTVKRALVWGLVVAGLLVAAGVKATVEVQVGSQPIGLVATFVGPFLVDVDLVTWAE